MNIFRKIQHTNDKTNTKKLGFHNENGWFFYFLGDRCDRWADKWASSSSLTLDFFLGIKVVAAKLPNVSSDRRTSPAEQKFVQFSILQVSSDLQKSRHQPEINLKWPFPDFLVFQVKHPNRSLFNSALIKQRVFFQKRDLNPLDPEQFQQLHIFLHCVSFFTAA